LRAAIVAYLSRLADEGKEEEIFTFLLNESE
jgi:hypothetical protein